MLCPVTHYDMIKGLRPDFVSEVKEMATTYSNEKFAHIDAQIDEDHFIPVVRKELARTARIWLSRQGYRESWIGMLPEEQLIPMMPSDFATQMFSSMRVEYLQIGNFHAFGKKAFYFGADLTRKLADTELNMPSEMLVPPFPSCMFVYDSQSARDAVSAFFKMPRLVEGVISVYVNHIARTDGGTKVIFYLTVTDRKKNTHAAAMRGLLIDEGLSVENALRTDWVKVQGGAREHQLPGYETLSTASDEAFYNEGLRIFRIIANSLLYLASSSADTEVGVPIDKSPGVKLKSPREVRRLAASTSSLEYIVVGRNTSSYASEITHTDRVQDQRFKVRGHWRNQAHGPAMGLRKFIHIEPYWKGPEAAEIINKPYVVR
jgi:hypothetical protein